MFLPLTLILIACQDILSDPDRTLTTVEIHPRILTVDSGQVAQFQSVFLDQRGDPFDPIPSWLMANWSGDDPSLEVRSDGSVATSVVGESQVTVDVAGLQGQATLRTNPLELTGRIEHAYIVQVTQRPDGSVPLIRGKDGLLRVFMTGDRLNFFELTMKATIQPSEGPFEIFELTREEAGVPADLDQGRLMNSWNTMIPGRLLQPGTTMFIEVVPEQDVPLSDTSLTRFPASGSLGLAIRDARPIELRLVPLILSEVSRAMPYTEEDGIAVMMELAGQVFPVERFDISVGEIFRSDATTPQQLLRDLEALRISDGGENVYYQGVIRQPPDRDIANLFRSHSYIDGYLGFFTDGNLGAPAYRLISTLSMARNLGRNFGLQPIICSSPTLFDPEFPYAEGYIGVYGYSAIENTVKGAYIYRDVSANCNPNWISDYSFERIFNVLDQRHEMSSDQGRSAEPGLLVWGGIEGGELILEPAFELNLVPQLPSKEGAYRIEGLDPTGSFLFSYSFEPLWANPVLRSGGFAFAIPASTLGGRELFQIRLSGPEGVTTRTRTGGSIPRDVAGVDTTGNTEWLSWNVAGHPAALIRDPGSGKILGISRTGSFRPPHSLGPVEVILSDGVGSSTVLSNTNRD